MVDVTSSTISDLNSIFCKPRRERLYGGATPSYSSFQTKKYVFLFNRQSLDTRESHNFPRLARPRQTHYCQPPRMVQPITSFRTKCKQLIFFPIHSHLLDTKSLYHWQGVAFTRSFLCKYNKQFKGATSLGRHICPVCN